MTMALEETHGQPGGTLVGDLVCELAGGLGDGTGDGGMWGPEVSHPGLVI